MMVDGGVDYRVSIAAIGHMTSIALHPHAVDRGEARISPPCRWAATTPPTCLWVLLVPSALPVTPVTGCDCSAGWRRAMASDRSSQRLGHRTAGLGGRLRDQPAAAGLPLRRSKRSSV